ncbi:MAG: hypothetical protein ACUVWR_06545 [Anaerolineae bacterium]
MTGQAVGAEQSAPTGHVALMLAPTPRSRAEMAARMDMAMSGITAQELLNGIVLLARDGEKQLVVGYRHTSSTIKERPAPLPLGEGPGERSFSGEKLSLKN